MSDAPSESNTRTPARLPWDFHPALTEKRLRFCARLLANARRDAVALAAYEIGDDNWSVGCRAYAFGKQRLKRVAESGAHAWLSVMDDSHHFVFLIEPVPVRFYRGLAEDPTVRTLRRQSRGAAARVSVRGRVGRRVDLPARGGGKRDRCCRARRVSGTPW
jgi:hypothetical protein